MFMGKEDKKIPLDAYKLHFSDMAVGLEPYYFHMLKSLGIEGFEVHKTKDLFAASEMSSFWGDMARRRGEQEQKAMQLMGTINGMIKDLFKIMREISIIDQRVGLYEKSFTGDRAGDSGLKDVWISLVEGGSKNPTSVIGLATQVGFIALPDYFYTTQIKREEQGKEAETMVNTIVDKLYGDNISEKLSYTLKRKLEQFVMWREITYKELITRRNFTIGVLKTLISELKLYTDWVRPYVKSIRKLKNSYSGEAKGHSIGELETKNPELVSSFETSIVELELKAVKTKKEKWGDNVFVAKITFKQTTSPAESFQKNYQKGFTHRGNVTIEIKGYHYTQEEWDKENEKDNKDFIDFLTENVDSTIGSLKEQLEKMMKDDYYKLMGLKESEIEEELKKKEENKKEEKKEGMKEFMLNLFPLLSIIIKDKKEEKQKKGSIFGIINRKQEMYEKDKQKAAFLKTFAPGREDREDHMNSGNDGLYKLYDLYKIYTRLPRIDQTARFL